MFRKRDPQGNLFESSGLLPDEKKKRLKASWADAFRDKALPLIDEEPFARMYCDDNGRPNSPVEVVFVVLLLKEMFNLTDLEALEQLEFNLLWHHALRLTPEEAHLCQKTLHNFRARLIEHDLARLAFEETTDRIIEALGIKTRRQRLDSTHITSNFAVLTRLGLFCETIRVFLHELSCEYPQLPSRVPEKLLGRYLKEEGEATRFGDARSSKARRRLGVCARDVSRLLSLFGDTEAAGLESYGLLERLFREQCEVVSREGKPKRDDEDEGEGARPVDVKDPQKVASNSVQTPHDPDVTYSGHKGKGYSVQVAESCHEDNAVEILTHVEVTDASESDARVTIPVIESLDERGHKPEELDVDTSYGSGENGFEAARRGTELVSPVGGTAPEGEIDLENPERVLSAADFEIDACGERATICPAGCSSIEELADRDATYRVQIHFEKETCESCPQLARCPAKLRVKTNSYVLQVDLRKVNIEKRRRAEASGEFAKRYAIRAGIEATNSELKRGHGLGRLRVRGRPRVELAVYLKALGCNIKRMVRACMPKTAEMNVQVA